MDYILKIRPRILMIILDIISILSILIQCISLNFMPLFIGRLLIGIIVGFNSGLVPKYIYGVCPK
jgi:predicted MFS family arabinose efflux permease